MDIFNLSYSVLEQGTHIRVAVSLANDSSVYRTGNILVAVGIANVSSVQGQGIF